MVTLPPQSELPARHYIDIFPRALLCRMAGKGLWDDNVCTINAHSPGIAAEMTEEEEAIARSTPRFQPAG